MSILHPDRVLAAFLRSGTAAMFRPKHEFTQPEVPPAVYEIPTMVNFGIGERGNLPWDGSIATFQDTEPRGSHWARSRSAFRTLLWDSRYLAIPFFDACLQMRLTEWNKILRPVDLSSAWLAAPFGDTATAAAEFRGDPKTAAWLPNKAVAKIWTEYVRTGTVTDAGAPPAPVNVRANANANHGNEITWKPRQISLVDSWLHCASRRAWDSEASNATSRSGVWTPTLPGLSYHDTPFAPLPQMRHVDTAAQLAASTSIL